jgi:molybdopterin-guanine dinucleotide biosynthesis protein A
VIENVSCAAILAGGQSSRMKREKALIEVDGIPLVKRSANVLRPLFSQIVVVTFKPEIAESADLYPITDLFPNNGPLGGIHAALKYFEQPTFIIACDMPFLSPQFIEEMCHAFSSDALIPQHENGIEPLHAIYSPTCIPVFEEFLSSGQKIPSFANILSHVNPKFIPTPTGFNFENWNQPSDIR